MTRNLQVNAKSPGTRIAGLMGVVGPMCRSREPRTILGVAKLTGVGRNTLAWHFVPREGEGLISRTGKQGKNVLYPWNPELRRDWHGEQREAR